MASTTGLLSVEQFAARPDSDMREELVDGEVISMPPASNRRSRIATRLIKALSPHEGSGAVVVEFGYIPYPDRPVVRAADVAWVSRDRIASNSSQLYLTGAPELVIEVLSPSNISQQMIRRRREAFDGGCLEFWLVDPESKTVEVSLPDGSARTYSAGVQVPVGPLGGVRIAVDAIFTE